MRNGATRWGGILLAACAAALSGTPVPLPAGTAPSDGGSPRVAAILTPHGPPDLPREALRSLFARALDATSLSVTPLPLPPGSGEAFARLLGERSGTRAERQAGESLAYEANEQGLDLVLLVGGKERSGRIALSLAGSTPPFRTIWSIETAPLPPESLALAAGLLADSTAARLGGRPAAARVFRPILLDAEDAFARGVRYGSIELLDRALALDGGHDGARSALGLRLALRGNRRKGIALLEAVDEEKLGGRMRAIHEARLAIARRRREETGVSTARLRRNDPGRFETFLLGGIAALRANDLDEARAGFTEALRLRPLDPLPHRLLAEAALRGGVVDVARDEYRRALGLSGLDFLSAIGIASADYTEGMLAGAEEILARPPPVDPHGIEGIRPYTMHMSARAGLRLACGRFGEARADLGRARREAYRLGDDEGVLDLTIRLFHAYLESDSLGGALRELQEIRYRCAGEETPTLPPGTVAYLEGLLGAYRREGGTVAAKRLELETIDGADPAWEEMIDGRLSLFRGAPWEAVPPLRRALRLGGGALVRHLLGRASLASERAGRAIDYLERVVEGGELVTDLPPVLPLSFYYLGRAFEERGEREEARLAFHEFLHYWGEADPGRPERIHAHDAVSGGRRADRGGR